MTTPCSIDHRMPSRIIRLPLALVLAVLAPLASASVGAAVQPSAFTHASEADFEPGKMKDVVLTSLGEVQLGRGHESVGKLPEGVTAVHDIQPLAGSICLAATAGGRGAVLAVKGREVTELLGLEREQVFALDVSPDGRLLAAVSSEDNCRLLELRPDGPAVIAELPGVRYVWDTLVVDKTIYLATGTEGELLSVDTAAAGGAKVNKVLDTAQSNLLCLARDGRGRLYFGTDGEGLVYRVTLGPDGTGAGFVMLDAAEAEVSSIVVDDDGTVYAATAAADQAKPGRMEEAKAEDTGKPDAPAPAPGDPAPGEEPEPGDPEPPAAPIPVPPQPQPIQPPAGDAAQPVVPDGPSDPAPSPQRMASDTTAPPPADRRATHDDGVRQDGKQEPPTATAEQLDALRAEVRRRLDASRKSGALAARPTVAPRAAAGSSVPAGRQTSGGNAGAEEGNAIYRIDPQGFVSEVFRESVMILRLAFGPGSRPDRPTLLAATGNEGQLFRVDPLDDRSTVMLKIDPQQITALAAVPPAEGAGPSILLATANAASLVRLGIDLAPEGTYTSPALDAGQVSLWGMSQLTAAMPPGTEVVFQTRSGNVEDPEQAPWSDWSQARPLHRDHQSSPLAPIFLGVDSPPARFIQYRLTLRGDGKSTPTVSRVSLAHVTPNLTPVIASITTTYPNAPEAASTPGPGGGGKAPARGPRPPSPGAAGAAGDAAEPAHTLTINWEASDPNNDTLRYTLDYKPASAEAWIRLADKLDQNTHDWDTRTAPDGWYLVRVTATDAADNPGTMARRASRVSAPVAIDNTPPTVEQPRTRFDAAGLTLTFTVTDNLSSLRGVQYKLPDGDDWLPVLPDDLISDSTREAFTITISPRALGAGTRVLSIRATDGLNNTAYRNVQIDSR